MFKLNLKTGIGILFVGATSVASAGFLAPDVNYVAKHTLQCLEAKGFDTGVALEDLQSDEWAQYLNCVKEVQSQSRLRGGADDKLPEQKAIGFTDRLRSGGVGSNINGISLPKDAIKEYAPRPFVFEKTGI